MSIDSAFLHAANKRIHATLMELRPKLLAVQGTIEHELKDDKSVVTEMDILVEDRLRAALHDLDPSIGFSGEESGVDYAKQTFWLVDPIDGTELFLRDLPFATNMIALIHKGEVVMGIIYNFSLDEYYLAIRGEGATCNGHPIHVSDRPLERSFIFLASIRELPTFSHGMRPRVAGQPKFHASGGELTAIARGAADGTITIGSKGAWDFAAGLLLIMEAGGRVENLYSDTYNYQDLKFVAANPVIFDELKSAIETALPAKS